MTEVKPEIEQVEKLIESLNRRASKGGCCGFTNEACYEDLPDNEQEWCNYCAMEMAAKYLSALITEGPQRQEPKG